MECLFVRNTIKNIHNKWVRPPSKNHRIEYGRTTEEDIHTSLTKAATYNEPGELQKILQAITEVWKILKWRKQDKKQTESKQKQGGTHLFTIRFLDKTLAKQHLTPQNDPRNDPQKWPQNMTQKITKKITLQNYPSKSSPLIHANKAQGHAEIKIIRYMKRVKTEFCLQNCCDSPNKF